MKSMKSHTSLTIILVAVIVVLGYQTVALAYMSTKLEAAEFGIGASPSAINLTDDGSTPEMVGGC